MKNSPALAFVKGHGTQNDFVILPDRQAQIELTEELTAALCDRQRGLGADGVLRVATAGSLVAEGVLERLPDGVSGVDWFMDYRNADGSIAEMCGNGVRVFAHFCRAEGLVDSDEFTVGSRAGARPVRIHSADETDAEVSVSMGPVVLEGAGRVGIAGRTLTGEAVDVGNPHLACVVDGLTVADLAGLDLTTGAELDAAQFPHGANVEILTPLTAASDGGSADFHAHMRVFERGVGETRSCGTGLVAAAAAALSGAGRESGAVAITVPGGDVLVTVADGSAVLRGPSRLVARGELLAGWAD
ncbi:diaminopimelate epimerase [Gordonia neofelifaecis]|uniref:Diaminopimelate epimerase n=1 Tax=Gordonia neofelifaecis NRRL B-59395 TaxID=644548 RepID=F1YMU2_9ACTN|nr:diaminopimelate epimerase [Gordonia neofelifaecis]EGD54027.1 diaminopimelate epimerase [Gordonia neofelifaecis NRRL B-59395]